MPEYHGPLGVALRDVGVPAATLLDWAQAAEAGGYSGIWVPEISGHDAVSTMAALAVRTSRALLGTGVIPVFSRPPVVLAQAAASLDDLSGGRFVLGIGAGGRAATEQWFATGWTDPFSRLEATVAAVRAAAAGEEVDVAWSGGRSRRWRLAFPPVRKRPPVVLAALNPRMLALAGRLADGVLLNWLPVDAVAGAVGAVRSAAEAAGRDPAAVVVAAYVRVHVGDLDGALDDLRPQVRSYLELPTYAAMLRRAGIADVDRLAGAPAERRTELVARDTVAALVAAGSAGEVAARLEAYRAAGVDLPIAYPLPAGTDPAASVRATVTALAPSRALAVPAAWAVVRGRHAGGVSRPPD